MDSATEKEFDTNTVNLGELEIKNLYRCNDCLSKQKTGKTQLARALERVELMQK